MLLVGAVKLVLVDGATGGGREETPVAPDVVVVLLSNWVWWLVRWLCG